MFFSRQLFVYFIFFFKYITSPLLADCASARNLSIDIIWDVVITKEIVLLRILFSLAHTHTTRNLIDHIFWCQFTVIIYRGRKNYQVNTNVRGNSQWNTPQRNIFITQFPLKFPHFMWHRQCRVDKKNRRNFDKNHSIFSHHLQTTHIYLGSK